MVLKKYYSSHLKRLHILLAILLVMIASLVLTLVISNNDPKYIKNSNLDTSIKQTSCALSKAISHCSKPTTTARTYIGPVGQSGDWNLAFGDEFNANKIDLTKWIMCNPSYEPQAQCLPYNNEQEIYNTSLPSNTNVNVSGGKLSLVATKLNNQIYSGMVSTGPNVFGYDQSSYKGFQFTYGYVEVAAKLPSGNGFWPSVWMLPDENKYGPWPDSGEYDVLESAGNDPVTIYMSEHDGTNTEAGDQATDQVSNASSSYHLYGFDWEPDHLAWYIDGHLARSMICTNDYAAAHPGTCDSYRNANAIKNYPFFIIMNFAVGGNWSALNGGPDNSTPFPSTMSIDWIHVWQHSTS